MIKNFLLVSLAIGLLASCGNKPKSDESNADSSPVSTEISVEQWQDVVEDYIGESVTIEGTIVHVCAHGGKRFFISNPAGDARIKVEMGDAEAAFSVDNEGAIVKVTAIVEELRVDNEYLDEWQAEIEAKIAEGEEGHHDHEAGIHEGEEGHEHRGQLEELERVAELRKEIAENGKGYKSYFNLAYQSHELLTDAPETDELEDELEEEGDTDQE